MNKVDHWFNRAYTAHQAGNLAAAEPLYRKILRKKTTDPETLFLLGSLKSQQGRHDEAEGLLRRALVLRPDSHETLNNLALALREQGRPEQAELLFRRALELKPDYAVAHNNLAGTLGGLGQIESAVASYRRALELDPDYADAHYNLGLLLQKQDRFTEALESFQRALTIRPDHAQTYNDLGSSHKGLGQFDEAVDCFRTAIRLQPSLAKAHNNLGSILQELGELEPALASYRKALELAPGTVDTYWNTAYLWLSLGELAKGWEAFEWRWRRNPILKKLPFPEWDGAPLAGKTILVYAEQGLGDEILFASCIPDLIDQAEHVIIECEARLAMLYARSFPTATVRGAPRRDDHGWLATTPAAHVQAPVGGLPRFLRPDLASFPKRRAYLYADPERVAYWRRWLSELGPGLNVGFCWRSGLTTGERYKNYPVLEQCAGLLGTPGTRFINLQYDDCAAELAQVRERYGVEIVQPDGIDLRNDQDELAALLTALDLTLSAGTAVAELAGALGVPVWRLDPGVVWIRLGTDHMPWHPSMRVFSKTSPREGWEPLLAQVAEALAALRPADLVPCPEPPVAAPALSPVQIGNLLAVALNAFAAEQPETVKQLCQRVLEAGPRTADAWHLLGLAEQRLEHPEAALEALNRAADLKPQEASIYCNRGSLWQSLGRLGEAVADYHQAVALNPDFYEAQLYLGTALLEQGKAAEAEGPCRAALTLSPTKPAAHDALGLVLRALGRPDQAEAAHRQALALAPGHVPAWINLGNVMDAQDRPEDAEACYRQALTLQGESPDALLNLGRLLRHRGQLAAAEGLLRQALALRPGHPETLNQLGNALRDQGRAMAAADCCRQVLESVPDDPRSHWNLALALLQAGDLEAGWAEYRWRWRGGIQSSCPYPYPDWDGGPLQGHLLVYAEQGLGDEILFASCLPELLADGPSCVVECDPRLTGLFRRAFPQATVVGGRRDRDDWDSVAPGITARLAAGDLPGRYRASLEDFPKRAAYLAADADRAADWTRRLAGLGEGLKVGIAWRSRLHGGERYRHYSRLEQWGAVLAVPGSQFVNLQYDDCAAELAIARERFGVKIADFDDLDRFNDLEGLAALIAGLDLVIAAGTAVAELAAALGVPVWRLDAGPVWTSLGAKDMPWHPSMRLFCKDGPEQPWEPLLERVAAELRRAVSGTEEGGDETLACCRHGLMLFDPAQGPAGPALARDGDYAGVEADWLVSLLKPGQVVVETDAGEGAHTLALAQVVGDDGLVLAFETRRRFHERLCANLALNQLQRVLPLRQVLGEGEGSVADPDRPTGEGSIDRWLGRRGLERVSLDSLELPRCDLLVIGGETVAAVLRGGVRTLAAYKPLIYIRGSARADDPVLMGALEASGYAPQHAAMSRDETLGVLALPVV